MSTNTANLTNYHPDSPSRQIEEYLDILHHERPRAPHPMSLEARAAQFSPYAALVGHKDIISADENLAQNKTNLDHEIILDTSFADTIYPDDY